MCEYGIESESPITRLRLGDGSTADPGDYDALTLDVASDAASELGTAVLYTLHELQNTLVADGLLCVCGPHPRESLQGIHEQSRVIHDEVPHPFGDDLIHALVHDLGEIGGLDLIIG